ncbi:MAG: ribokinase, partial [Clostridia bacterium]
MKKIYVVGSLNMDLVINTPYLPQKGETMFGNDFFSNCGGKGLNQAIAIAKLGGNVEMIGCVGDDEFGKQLIQNLLTCGAQTQNISVVKNVSTGTAIILVCDCDNRIILDAGANSELTFEAVKSGLVNANKGDLLICQMEIPLEVVKQTIIYAKSIGLFTILNPSPARKLDSELLQKIDLLVPNETELQALTDTDSIQQGISNLLELGAKEVIVTV